MATPRYKRDRHRRYGVPDTKHIRSLHVFVGGFGGFFVVYVLFLTRWRFRDISKLEGFASTEQFRNLRKAINPVNDASNQVHDVEVKAMIEQQGNNEEHMRPITMKVVPPTIARVTAAPVASIDAVEATEKDKELQKVRVTGEDAEGRALLNPEQMVEEMTTSMQERVQLTDMAAPVKPAEDHFAIEDVPTVLSFAKRHHEIYGYDATKEFLKKYQYNPDESLFLFFMCSDGEFRASDWSEKCVEGKKHVYDVFSKSPGHNRLVTVFAGSEKYWHYQNDFSNDLDLKVKGVPCIMKWVGRSGRTEGMLLQESLYDEPFLRYLFKNTDQTELLFASEDTKNKQIITLKGYNSYVNAMIEYEKEENPVPTFLMMVSGRSHKNNRPWCPYCRYSELPVEYAFYSYAPKNARLIRVEVADSYSKWKKMNEFTRDENLRLTTVPLMFQLEPIPVATANDSTSIRFVVHKIPYDELAPLRELFTSFA